MSKYAIFTNRNVVLTYVNHSIMLRLTKTKPADVFFKIEEYDSLCSSHCTFFYVFETVLSLK